MAKKEVKKTAKKVKLGKFEKFDKAENEIKVAEDSVQDLAKDFEKGNQQDHLTRAAVDLEKAEAEVEEADEEGF